MITVEKQREMLRQAEKEKTRRKGRQKPIAQRWQEEEIGFIDLTKNKPLGAVNKSNKNQIKGTPKKLTEEQFKKLLAKKYYSKK